eukprot:scaffold1953_cov176-Amphora_coffeaeformis.AAC.57
MTSTTASALPEHLLGFVSQASAGKIHMKPDIVVQRSVQDILGWPTDTFSIDCGPPEKVHTILVFIPGNPGLCEWYIPLFSKILETVGPGYVARGASYVGHSIDPQLIYVENEQENSETNIPPKTLAWTMDGQVHHKIAYIDQISKEFPNARFIFVGHSIGCHFTKRILLYRTDILRRTCQCILLMPFIRMDAPAPEQHVLDLASRNVEASMWILHTLSRFLSILPSSALETILKPSMDRENDRIFTAKLLKQSQFTRNFLGLGSEEIRDVPQAIDVCLTWYRAFCFTALQRK